MDWVTEAVIVGVCVDGRSVDAITCKSKSTSRSVIAEVYVRFKVVLCAVAGSVSLYSDLERRPGRRIS